MNGVCTLVAVGRQTLLDSAKIKKYLKTYLIFLSPVERNELSLTLWVLKPWLLSHFDYIARENPFSLSPLPHHLFIHPLTHYKCHSSFLCLWMTHDLIPKSNSCYSFVFAFNVTVIFYPAVGKFLFWNYSVLFCLVQLGVSFLFLLKITHFFWSPKLQSIA